MVTILADSGKLESRGDREEDGENRTAPAAKVVQTETWRGVQLAVRIHPHGCLALLQARIKVGHATMVSRLL